jgi:nucleotide-binding universal stress UspA family protein
MSWARIMAPLCGGPGDAAALEAAITLARPFGAEVAGVHAPADISELAPWMGEGFMGGVQAAAIDSLREAAAAGRKAAEAEVAGCGYDKTDFVSMEPPVWAGLALEGRLSDVVVFCQAAAQGRGALAEAFEQIVADEQRPTLVARQGLKAGGVVAVAWDGGKEASRAARTALPWLQQAAKVVLIGAPEASSRKFDLLRLHAFLAARGVTAQVAPIAEKGDAADLILKTAKTVGADLLVAGAFGHPRLQEFIFGGATRSLLNAADGPSLFLSH